MIRLNTKSIEIYKYSFPADETRPADKIVDMLRNDQDYHLFISLNNELVIGMSLLYVFSSLRMGLLDYIAVIPNLRGQDIGNNLFNFTLKFRSIVSNGVDLMMEVQKDNARNLQGTLRKKRIKFYLQLGGKILDDVNYLLSPITIGVDPREMYLIMRALKQINYLSKQNIIAFIEAVYSTLYQYQGKDLLYKTGPKQSGK